LESIVARGNFRCAGSSTAKLSKNRGAYFSQLVIKIKQAGFFISRAKFLFRHKKIFFVYFSRILSWDLKIQIQRHRFGQSVNFHQNLTFFFHQNLDFVLGLPARGQRARSRS
jgi:hypothetical protein